MSDVLPEEVLLRFGVDGGGTATTCVILTPDDAILAKFVGGSTNVNSVRGPQALANLEECVVRAIALIPDGFGPYRFSSFGASMSSCDRPADQVRVKVWVKQIVEEKSLPVTENFEDRICVESDAVGALCSGTLGEIRGVVLIAGTGMICYGFLNGGKTRMRAGGWGPRFMDGGCGFWIGQQALEHISKHWDTDPEVPDELTTRLMGFLHDDLKDVELGPPCLIEWAYRTNEWHRLASLARPLLGCAAEVPAAMKIVESASQQLCDCVDKVCNRIQRARSAIQDEEPLQLVLSGGLLAHEGSLLMAKVKDHTLKAWPGLFHSVVNPRVHPAVGSALMCNQ